MTDKKFTQEQIIKALECCKRGAVNRCKGCPYRENIMCALNLRADALDLINRLKTRIVRYQLKNTNQRNALASLNKKVAEQKAMLGVYETCNARKDEAIRHLEAEIERLKDHNKQLRYDRKQITIEAIKGFAKRLKALFINDFRFYRKTEDIVEKDLKRIDNLVKEITEGK